MSTEIKPKNSAENTLKKRVLFVITQSEFGGAQRFLYTLVTHLESGKYEILVACGADGDGSLINALKQAQIATHSLSHLRRNIDPKNDILAVRELASLIRQFQPDTLFLNSSKAGVIGSLAGRKFPRLRVVYRIGGWSFNDPWPTWKKKLWIFLEQQTAKYKDVIIVNNRHDFDQAKTLHIKPREKLELIHNGLDISDLHLLSRGESRSELEKAGNCKLEPETFLIGTIANFYPPKGLEFLIEAINILNTKYEIHNTSFLLIGDGEERNKLESLIKNHDLLDRVILVGRLDNTRQYLKAFDIFVLPSVKEGFPWAVLEAMAAGLPVIATRVGAIPEIIQDNHNGLIVPPGDSQALSSAITSLLTDESKRQQLGSSATQTVSENFSLSKMVKEIEVML